MTINDQIRDEKLQYDINRKAAKISALSSVKIHKYEYVIGEDILASNQQEIIQQARFTYSALGKVFEKQIKTIEDQRKKQLDGLNNDENENALNNDEAKKKHDKIKEIEKNVDTEKLIYETNEYTCSFKNLQKIKTFDRDIYDGKIMIEEADKHQTNLLVEIMNFRNNTKSRNQEKNETKKLLLKTCIMFLRAQKKLLTLLKAKCFR